jgi:hypothetical protein
LRSSSNATGADLQLQATEAETLAVEAKAFARALPDPAARARYERLAAACVDGAVPSDLISALEAMLELVLDTGRPSNRAILQAIFARTPRSRQRGEAAQEVNHALQTLRGQTLSEVRVSPGGPSRHSLVIETDRCRLTLEIDRDGVRVSALETG